MDRSQGRCHFFRTAGTAGGLMALRRLMLCLLLSAGAAWSRGAEIRVTDSPQLRAALTQLTPGTTLRLEPGVYEGGMYLADVTGTPEAPAVIQGAEPNDPPIFRGSGGQALHLADCSYVVLRNLRVEGFPGNGINIDDGGSFATPAHHVTLENVTILRIGPKGNHDALKMSGVDHFAVRRCRFEGWGGSGIDMVGCHHGVVEDCTFVGRVGFEQSNAVQLKGGTADVLVQCCLFRNAGERCINLGGSTGLQFFRPRVQGYEATGITVAGNRFEGSPSPVAWVTADGGHVHHNTIVLPEKWVLRILQETQDAQFAPSHGGIFEDNLVFFDGRVQVFVNVGPRTAPETFFFRRNVWCDVEGSRRPALPIEEQNGVYLSNVGAEAYRRVEIEDAKSEIRSTKSETNPQHKLPMFKTLAPDGASRLGFRILGFEFVSDFEIRYSHLISKEQVWNDRMILR